VKLFVALLVFVWQAGAAPVVLKVQVRSGSGTKVVEMPLERYVTAVLTGESSIFRSDEALKAMAVAARTYAIRMRGRHRAEGFDFCDTTHCQRLELNPASERVQAAVGQTAGELLWYEGKPAFTPYTRDCGGRTEDAGAVWPDQAEAYLKSHVDEYCTRAGKSAWRWIGDPREIVNALRRSGLRAPENLDGISILARTPSNRASTLLLQGAGEFARISAGSFRFAIGRELGWNTIRSDSYTVHSSNGHVIFEGSGFGHGVGLCQNGAEQMGLDGRTYHDILAFYYPGTVVGVTGQEISWQRLGGETIALMTTQPDQDKLALSIAERLAKSASVRTGWPIPANIEIRVYPDVETFRNATGEPGWVAAHTAGRRIHLQPAAVLESRNALESTLSHELMHVLVEAQAIPDLPLWFREGLVNFLVSGRGDGLPRIPADSQVRDTRSDATARRAYADATAFVATLVARYGEPAVLAWVRRGVPPEVTKASNSQAATKSK
jgi:stage II sporulation protein D